MGRDFHKSLESPFGARFIYAMHTDSGEGWASLGGVHSTDWSHPKEEAMFLLRYEASDVSDVGHGSGSTYLPPR